MKPTVLGAAVVALLILTIAMWHRQFWIQQYEEDSDVIWNDAECFVIVRLTTVGWEGNRVRRLAGAVWPRVLRRDATLFRWTSDGLERHAVRGSISAGRFVGYDNSLFLITSQHDRPSEVRRWTGSALAAAEPERAEAVRSFFESARDTLGAPGWSWHEGITSIPVARKSYTMRLETAEVSLTVERDLDAGRTRSITLVQPRGQSELLYAGPSKWSRVGSEEYRALARSGAGGLAAAE